MSATSLGSLLVSLDSYFEYLLDPIGSINICNSIFILPYYELLTLPNASHPTHCILVNIGYWHLLYVFIKRNKHLELETVIHCL